MRLLSACMFVAVLATNFVANAGDDDWIRRVVGRECDIFGYCQPVYRWVPRRLDDEREHCAGSIIHATSVVHDTEQGAMDSARMVWGALARSEWGERYMDVQQAADVRTRCYRASTNETLLGKAAGAFGAFQWRCEVKARPCRPGWTYERRAR